jgi:hypothetical protein
LPDKRGRLAQLGEHLLDVQRVSGSSPLTSTNKNGNLQNADCRFFCVGFAIFANTLNSG